MESQQVWTRLRLEHAALALLLAVTLVKGTLWSIAVPLWRGIDENVHFSTAQFIAEHGRLPGPDDVFRADEIMRSGELADVARLPFRPTQRQTFVPGRVGLREAEILALDPALRTSYETQAQSSAAHAPPLYHALAAGVYRLTYSQDILTRAFAMRQLSVLLGVLAVFLGYLIAREVFPAQPMMCLAVPLLVSFHPMFTFLTATVNTDAPLFLIFTGLIYVLVRAVRRGFSYSLGAAFGAVGGAGMLVKPLVVTLAWPLLFALILELRGRRDRWKWMAKILGLMALCALLVYGWGLARNIQVSGNPFYLVDPNISSYSPVRQDEFGQEVDMRRYPWGQYLRNHASSLVGGLFVSYWADFGALDTPLAPVYYRVLLWVLLAAGLGLGLHFWQDGRKRWRISLLLVICVLSHLVMLGAYDRYFWTTYGVGAVGQGKYYLYPAAAQFSLLVLSIAALFPRKLRVIGVFALCVAMVSLNFVSLLGYLLPRYYL